jgi:hypothetical protein
MKFNQVLKILIVSAICLSIGMASLSLDKKTLFAGPKKGLAMAYPNLEDLQMLDPSWYYVWGGCPADIQSCVPMSWCGEDPNLALNYSDYILLFNEPEVETQCNISPQTGINRYMILQAKYSNAKWVVGNNIFWGSWQNWLNLFWDICNITPGCKMPDYWGVHVYISGEAWISYVRSELERLHNKVGGTFWITEFAEITGNINVDNDLVNLFESTLWIDRWAYFTNRAEETEWWYPAEWNVQLIEWGTDSLTPIGMWFVGNIYRTFLPIIANEALCKSY